MRSDDQEHYCNSVDSFPPNKFLQTGQGKGRKILILGEAPAPNGWRKSGKAFYTLGSTLLPSGKNLNKLLSEFGLSVEICGFTELVKCYVGKDRKLLSECGKRCWPIFLKQLRDRDYSLIIILGVKTLEILNEILNTSLKVGELAHARIENKKYSVLPIYHPSPAAPFSHSRNTSIFHKYHRELKVLI